MADKQKKAKQKKSKQKKDKQKEKNLYRQGWIRGGINE